MEDEMKKVTFALIPQSGFSPDEKEQRELDEMARKRSGLFYGCTEVYENELKTLKFVIKDVATGEVFNVDPLLVKFIK